MKNQFENSGAGSHPLARKVINSRVFRNVKSFAQLERKISKIKNTKVKGAAWEIFRKFYMTQVRGIKEFYYCHQIPLEFKNKLRIPDGDKGIDCVYIDVDDSLVVGQDKFRSKSFQRLNWKSLSTFFGLSEHSDHRSVFTNCRNVSKVVQSKTNWSLINNFSEVTKSQWLSLEAWAADGLKVKVEPFENREHQIEAVRANVTMFNEGHDRLTDVLPCGAGKTAIAIMTLIEMNPKWAILYFPSVGLLNQTQKEFLKHHFNALVNYFSVTYDVTVTADMELYNDEAVDCEFPVTTKPEELKSKIKESISQNKGGLIFSTYQSTRVVEEACKGLISFDLGIFDEAHWTSGERNKEYSRPLLDSNIDIKKRLFLTATPLINDGCPTMFNSMDDPELYGVRAMEMSFRQGIDQEIICDYEVITSEIRSEEIDRELINFSEVEIKGNYERSKLVSDCITLKKAMDKHDIKKTFVYANSRDNARSFRQAFEKMNPDVKCFYVDGRMRAHTRNAILNSFNSSSKAILANVDVLNEGIDCPNADCVFFAQPRQSVNGIMQAVGRVLRRCEGKERGYVLIPTYVQKAEGEEVSEALYHTRNETIGNILVALAQHDEEWRELLRKEIIRLSQRGSSQSPFPDTPLGELSEISIGDLDNSITIASILAVLPNHQQNFEYLQSRYREEGNWNFIKTVNLKKNETRSFADFIGNLSQRAKKSTSVLHSYYDWLQENNYPWPVSKKQSHHEEVFLPIIEKIKEELNSGKKYNEFSKEIRDRLRDWKCKKNRSPEQLEILEDLLGLAWTNLPKYKFLEKIGEIKKDAPNHYHHRHWLMDWKAKENELDEDMSLLLNEVLKDVDTTEWGRREEARQQDFDKKLKEWKKWKQNDFAPKDKKFSDGTGMRGWENSMRAKLQDRDEYNNLTEGQKQDLIEAGFNNQIASKKRYTAKEGIKLVNQLVKYKDFKNLPEELDMFVKAMRSYYRRWVSRTSHLDAAFKKRLYKSKNFRAIEEKINKKIPDFPWMPSKNKRIPKIRKVSQISKAGTECFSYNFNITFNGETKTYARRDSKLLEEMRSKVMEAGHHIDFPRPSPSNKGLKKR